MQGIHPWCSGVKSRCLYKAGDAQKFSNYRPVSVLPVFSTVIEQLMYNHLLAHNNGINLLYKFQFGFRNKHSPNLTKICNALQNGELVLGLLLDFSKAFDTVDHDILLDTSQKTHFMMFRKRKQKITFNNELLIDDRNVEQIEKTKFLEYMLTHR